MLRFMDSRTWMLMNNVPATSFRLVKEILSLRQKIVSERQTIHFLRRCLQEHVMPNFISKKRIHEVCGLPKGSQHVKKIEQQLLRLALRSKQDHMYKLLSKCLYKEQCCVRYMPDRLSKRIVGDRNTSVIIFDLILSLDCRKSSKL